MPRRTKSLSTLRTPPFQNWLAPSCSISKYAEFIAGRFLQKEVHEEEIGLRVHGPDREARPTLQNQGGRALGFVTLLSNILTQDTSTFCEKQVNRRRAYTGLGRMRSTPEQAQANRGPSGPNSSSVRVTTMRLSKTPSERFAPRRLEVDVANARCMFSKSVPVRVHTCML